MTAAFSARASPTHPLLATLSPTLFTAADRRRWRCVAVGFTAAATAAATTASRPRRPGGGTRRPSCSASTGSWGRHTPVPAAMVPFLRPTGGTRVATRAVGGAAYRLRTAHLRRAADNGGCGGGRRRFRRRGCRGRDGGGAAAACDARRCRSGVAQLLATMVAAVAAVSSTASLHLGGPTRVAGAPRLASALRRCRGTAER